MSKRASAISAHLAPQPEVAIRHEDVATPKTVYIDIPDDYDVKLLERFLVPDLIEYRQRVMNVLKDPLFEPRYDLTLDEQVRNSRAATSPSIYHR